MIISNVLFITFFIAVYGFSVDVIQEFELTSLSGSQVLLCAQEKCSGAEQESDLDSRQSEYSSENYKVVQEGAQAAEADMVALVDPKLLEQGHGSAQVQRSASESRSVNVLTHGQVGQQTGPASKISFADSICTLIIPSTVLAVLEIGMSYGISFYGGIVGRICAAAALDVAVAPSCVSKAQALQFSGLQLVIALASGFVHYLDLQDLSAYYVTASTLYAVCVGCSGLGALLLCKMCCARKLMSRDGKRLIDARITPGRLLFDGLGTASGVIAKYVAVVLSGSNAVGNTVAGALSYVVRMGAHFLYDLKSAPIWYRKVFACC